MCALPPAFPLVTKLLGELPTPKRIPQTRGDMDIQIRGQCSSRQTGGPLRWDGNQKKMRGMAMLALLD